MSLFNIFYHIAEGVFHFSTCFVCGHACWPLVRKRGFGLCEKCGGHS